MLYKRQILLLLIAVISFSNKVFASTIFTVDYVKDTPEHDTLVILTDTSVSLNNVLLKNIATQENYTGKASELLAIPSASPQTAQRTILLGTGELSKLDARTATNLGATLAAHLAGSQAEKVVVDTQSLASELTNSALAAYIAHGLELRGYQFNKHHNRPVPKNRSVNIVVNDSSLAKEQHQKLNAITEGVFLARDLTNEPANVIYPETFAKEAANLKKIGVKVDILNEKDLKKHGLGALLAVGLGSINPPRLVIAHWKGSNEAPIVLVGKGITFDTGGYNIKTNMQSLMRMTTDMAGAAAVLGTVKALALQKAPVNVVAIMPLAENRISDRAYLPGDVIKTASGITVEISNTDAEGRLVLADGLWWANKHYNPAVIIDISTLTGAKFTALGSYYAGLFSESDELVTQFSAAGNRVEEKVWRLPLGSEFAGELRSPIADFRNTGSSAGASSAAFFLQQFAGDTPWVHLDIAGNAQAASSKGVTPEGANGFGVRLMTDWILANYQ